MYIEKHDLHLDIFMILDI